jgi:carbonic anhydrase
MSATDDLLANAERYRADFDGGSLPMRPALGVAIVTCMDARINVFGLLGLAEGDAHVIRNAGGAVGAGELRSLAISQRLLGTREIIVIYHTGCGMRTFRDDEFKAAIEAETGVRPQWPAETFVDPETDVRQAVERILADPFLPHKDSVRGFVYDVETGALNEVKPEDYSG